MNLIFLSSEVLHHYYLINEVNKIYPVKKVFFQTIHKEHVSKKIWKKRIGKLLDPKTTRFVIRGLLLRILFGREKILRERYERKMFFDNKEPSLDASIPSERVYSFNLEDAVEKVKREDPDLIIVFGTEVLKGEILNVAKFNILNIHSDIVPKYRGSGFPFWIFYNRDFENLGTTIHICAAKLDAGDIVGQKFYKLDRNDRIYMLTYKTTMLAIDILREVIPKYITQTVEYRKQEKSKLWSSKDLSILKHIIARRNFNNYIKTLAK